jgi:methyl-accepting chemotaxis protein
VSATKEIAVVIGETQRGIHEVIVSMQQSTNGIHTVKQLAHKSGEALTDIIAATNSVMEIVAEIESISREQASASKTIAQTMDALRGITERSTTNI